MIVLLSLPVSLSLCGCSCMCSCVQLCLERSGITFGFVRCGGYLMLRAAFFFLSLLFLVFFFFFKENLTCKCDSMGVLTVLQA